MICNVGFINTDNIQDETQVDIQEYNDANAETIDLINIILSLQKEMGIKEINYLEYQDSEEDKD